jgi:hypothetical protein
MNGVRLSRISRSWRGITSLFRVSPLPSSPLTQYSRVPATTVDVERVFSQGRLVLSHIRSHLSIQSTRALLCLGAWCQLGLVKGSDVKAALGDELVGEEEDLPTNWDVIQGL